MPGHYNKKEIDERVKGQGWGWKEFEGQPFDAGRCPCRVWNGGWGGQCRNAATTSTTTDAAPTEVTVPKGWIAPYTKDSFPDPAGGGPVVVCPAHMKEINKKGQVSAGFYSQPPPDLAAPWKFRTQHGRGKAAMNKTKDTLNEFIHLKKTMFGEDMCYVSNWAETREVAPAPLAIEDVAPIEDPIPEEEVAPVEEPVPEEVAPAEEVAPDFVKKEIEKEEQCEEFCIWWTRKCHNSQVDLPLEEKLSFADWRKAKRIRHRKYRKEIEAIAPKLHSNEQREMFLRIEEAVEMCKTMKTKWVMVKK